jgi:hypothetical protein
MADISATLAAWSSTTASNNPSGATTIGTGLDDNLRELQGVIVRGLSHKGSDIASATTTDIGAVEGLMHDITGTTTITGLGTVRAGILKALKFEGALTLTHNATSLILPGAANITTADGDVGIFISEGSGNWRCLGYMKAAGGHLGPVLATEQASTSGTSIDFTGIPPWAKKITVQLAGVSTNGTSALLIQIGDSGGIENTGYSSGAQVSTTLVESTAGFLATHAQVAAQATHGSITLTLEDSANFTWISSGTTLLSANGVITVAGSKSLSAALDRVRLTTVNGTDTFDAGGVNIIYE